MDGVSIYTAVIWIQDYKYLVFPLVDVQVYNDCEDVQFKTKCPGWIFKVLSCQKYSMSEGEIYYSCYKIIV